MPVIFNSITVTSLFGRGAEIEKFWDELHIGLLFQGLIKGNLGKQQRLSGTWANKGKLIGILEVILIKD